MSALLGHFAGQKGRLLAVLALLLVIGVVLPGMLLGQRVVLPPGVNAPDEPLQFELDEPVVLEKDGYTLTALAGFELRGKILSRKRYRTGREADLSPVDFAIGWGRMSDQRVVDDLDIRQRGRWYLFRYSGAPPIPKGEIERSSANMHIVPVDASVRRRVLDAKEGQVIELKGYLIRADASDGWRWVSSTTRGDTGDGACEIVLVEDFEVVIPG